MLLGYREWAVIPLLFAVSASFLTGRPHMFAVFAVMLAATIFWGKITRVCKVSLRRAPSVHRPSIRISDIRADTLVSVFRPVLRMGILQRVQNYIEQRIKAHILRSGSVQNPRVLGIKSVLYPLISCMVAVPAAVAASTIYGTAVMPVFFVPVLLLFAWYFVSLRFKADERRAGVEDELAPFAALAAIMGSVNVSLFSTLEMITRSPSNIFPMIRKEGARVRNITYLGRSPISALMELADSHPSIAFRNFLEGYVSSFNTGGTDTAEYMQEQSKRFFGFMQARMTRYTKQADMIAQLILTVMLLLPMMGLSMMFFATGPIAGTVMLLLIVIFPFLTIILITVVHAGQPKRRDTIRTSWTVFAAGGAVAVLVHLLGGQAWEVAGAAIVASAFLNAALVHRTLTESASAERQLPEFTRQIARLKNIGVDIMNGIRQIRQEIVASESGRFGGVLDGIIDRLYRAMVAGSSFDAAISKIEIPSWNVRLVFFILGKVHESGGGTAKTLDNITRWVTEYEDTKREMAANLRASLMTAFVGPVLMVMISAVSEQLSGRLDSNQELVSGLEIIPYGATQAGLGAMSEILTIVATVCMGVTLAKINYFTVRNTMFVGIIMSVTMVLMYVVPALNLFEL